MSPGRPGRRRRTALALALAAVVLAVPLGVYAWGRTSHDFAVRRVVVTGQRRIPTREVTTLLERRFSGENLFGISSGDVKKTLSVYPYLADVQVDHDYPDTLRVHITEYVPAALLFADGAWYVVSQEGRVLAELPPGVAGDGDGTSPSPATSPGTKVSPSAKARPTASPSASPSRSPAPGASGAPQSPATAGPLPRPPAAIVPRGMRSLPVMSSTTGVAVGQDVSDADVRNGLAVLAAIPTGLRNQVVAVVANGASLKAYLRSGVEVEFGDTSRLPDKVVALRAVLTRYALKHVRARFVDVSVPERPLGAPVLPTPRGTP